MNYRRLGKTNLKVSCIGFGALPLTGLNEEEAFNVLNTALDYKINFVDTARGYRESEELIGKSISSRRREFYLATKTRAREEKQIRDELETSLKILNTDTIDLYQIHYVNTEEELKDVLNKKGSLDTFRKIQTEGIINFIGITGHNTKVLQKACETGEFDTIQGAFSYIEKSEEVNTLIHYCSIRDTGFIAQKPLAGGAIACTTLGLKWILQYPVSIVIPGMVSKEQVIENSRVGDADLTLGVREIEELESIVIKLNRYFCRRCYYCHPACPEEIRIGVILEFFGKAFIPENLGLAKRWYRGMSINAQNCTECGLCLPSCPYELPIIDMLREAHELLK